MTEKEKLINLIQKENAAEQSAGRPYLRRGKATIKKIVNEISDQTAQVMLYSLENGKFDEICNHYFGDGTPVEIESAE